MKFTGKAFKFGNNLSTDLIISGRYKFSITDEKELAKHVMEDADPDFYKKITPGHAFIVAGNNFGMGSSREQAPRAIKASGVVAVLAKSFARIFYRNGINIGLPLIECDTDKIDANDELILDLDRGFIQNLAKNIKLNFTPLSKMMQGILKEDGLVNYYLKHKGLKIG